MKTIRLGNQNSRDSKLILVDDEDFQRVNMFTWYFKKNGYITTTFQDNTSMMLGRFILDITDRDKYVDHIDRDIFNNQKSNLRICNNSENNRNKGLQSNNTSGFKGVRLDKRYNRWAARIKVYGREYGLGYFDKPEQAARAYDKAAIKYFGEFAKLNFPINPKAE